MTEVVFLGTNAINTAINHIRWSLPFTAVETAVYTVYPRRGTQTISYKQVSKRSTYAFHHTSMRQPVKIPGLGQSSRFPCAETGERQRSATFETCL